MRCSGCGGEEARVVLRPRVYGKGGTLLVIEDVPIISCRSCGQDFLSAETVRELDRIRRNRETFAVERPVAVAAFAHAKQEA